MDAAEHPGAAKKFLAVGGGERARKPIGFAARCKVAQDAVAQQIEHVWNGDQRCGALALHCADHFHGVWGWLEDYGGAEQRRNEQRHELAENVAERDKSHEAQGVKPPLVLAIRGDPALERLEICQEIAVSQNDATRFRGSAGGKQDLRDVVANDRLVGKGLIQWRSRILTIVVDYDDMRVRCSVI